MSTRKLPPIHKGNTLSDTDEQAPSLGAELKTIFACENQGEIADGSKLVILRATLTGGRTRYFVGSSKDDVHLAIVCHNVLELRELVRNMDKAVDKEYLDYLQGGHGHPDSLVEEARENDSSATDGSDVIQFPSNRTIH